MRYDCDATANLACDIGATNIRNDEILTPYYHSIHY